MTTTPTRYDDWAETFGPMEVQVLAEVRTVCERAEARSDGYAVLTVRQAETVTELLRWLGAPAYGTSIGQAQEDAGQRVDDSLGGLDESSYDEGWQDGHDSGVADGKARERKRAERQASETETETNVTRLEVEDE